MPDTPLTPSPSMLIGAPLAPSRNLHAEAAKNAAHAFEAMFLTEMLAPMFDGLDTEGLGGGGIGEQVFRPMLIEQYAAAIAHAGGIGLADSVTRELMRFQGDADAAAQTGGADGPHR